jgi:FtsH-binding integral membrane protein
MSDGAEPLFTWGVACLLLTAIAASLAADAFAPGDSLVAPVLAVGAGILVGVFLARRDPLLSSKRPSTSIRWIVAVSVVAAGLVLVFLASDTARLLLYAAAAGFSAVLGVMRLRAWFTQRSRAHAEPPPSPDAP